MGKKDMEESKTPTKTPSKTTKAVSYEDRVKNVHPSCKPLSSRKQTKKVYKLIKKCTAAKKMRRGVREVVKSLRKGVRGVCILAGDVSPLDVISHLPVFCEEKDVPYVFVPSRQDLGAAALSKRPTSAILLPTPKSGWKHKDLFDEVEGEVRNQE